jgi:hypothetical protein
MNCEELKSHVLSWFGAETECRASGKDTLIATLPILKPNGDPIEIGIEPTNGEDWRLSDMGDTYAVLYLAGVEMYEEYVRAEEFRQIVKAHHITDEERELSLVTSTDEMVATMFDFVQAIQSVLALQVTVKRKQPRRDFVAIVAKFLAEQRASFEIPAEHIEGKTGRWKFSFVMNHVHKETLVKAVTASTKGEALRNSEQSVFEIGDVKEVRDTDAVVIVDDEGGREDFWRSDVMRVFEGYSIPALPFVGGREELTQFASKYVA